MNARLRTPVFVVLCGGILIGLAMGVRHVQGLFLLPMSIDRGWSREAFAFAMAIQNLVWGLAQPITGMLADRFGSVRVLLGGCVLYATGLYLMTGAVSEWQLTLAAGLIIGVGLAATSFGVVYGALSRMFDGRQRAWALGLAGAVGGLGQFFMVPSAQVLISGYGWAWALISFAIVFAMAAPLAFGLNDRTPSGAGALGNQSMRAAIGEALSHRGFWLLNIGFLACGFQLAFIAGHLPAYLMDQGLAPRSAVIALSIIALANVAGTYLCGYAGALYRRKHLLAYIYLVRSVAMTVFIVLPVSEASVYVFAFVMGFIWLGTVPLTNGLLAQVFGVKYLATLFGFVFIGHQLGSFFGVWLGGAVFDATQSYAPIWLGSILLGLVAAALHWPIDDRQVLRLQTA